MTAMIVHPRPAARAPHSWGFPSARREVLPNGLTVISCDVPGRPIAEATLLVNSPFTVESPNSVGVSALTAKAYFAGTAMLDRQQLALEFARNAVSFGSRAGMRHTALTVSAPVKRLSTALALLADVACAPAFTASEVEQLVTEQSAWIKKRDSDPDAVVDLAVNKVIYPPQHRLSHPADGDIDTVSSLTATDVAAFYAQTVSAETSTLLVVGDLSATPADEINGTQLGTWTKNAPGLDGMTAPAVRCGRRIVLIDRPGAEQSVIRLVAPGPPRCDPGWEASVVAANILGGSGVSRLTEVLREQRGYTYGIHASLRPREKNSHQIISTSVETGVTAAALSEILSVLSSFSTTGPSEDEVSSAVKSLIAVTPLHYQTTAAIRGAIAETVTDDLSLDWHTQHHRRMQSLMTQDVIDAAQEWNTNEATIVIGGDATRITDSLIALGHGTFELMST